MEIHTYQDSGVDKENAYTIIENIKSQVKTTFNRSVLGGIGGFGAIYELGNYTNPVLISGADGVGTKLKVAFDMQIYNTVGIDCVAMCVNDILCHGAKPLFFLDYLAAEKLDNTIISDIVEGMVNGCLQSGAALIGGETAEMPGFYKSGLYDIAGFVIGIANKSDVIDGSTINNGDTVIALASSGVHSNGFSLIRSLITDLDEDFYGKTIGEELLIPTKIYVHSILNLLKLYKVNGIAHITGGGFIENIPRIIPDGLCANIDVNKIQTHKIFNRISSCGIDSLEMFSTFNMGVGLVLVVDSKDATSVLHFLESVDENAYIIGNIIQSQQKICLN